MSARVIVCAFVAWVVCAFAQSPFDPQPHLDQTHLNQAQEYLKQNRPDLAIRAYQAILQTDPKNLDARGNLGVLLFFQGDYAKAAPELTAALNQQPGLSKLRALLGMCQRRAGQLQEARKNLEEAFPQLKETKVRVQTGMELIELYFGSGDLDQAAGVAIALKQLDPTNPEALYAAQRIHSSLADESMLAMATVAPASAWMHQLMAHEMARQGNLEGAIAHYREALKLNSHLPGLHFELAEILMALADESGAAEAEREYHAAIADNPFDLTSECRLGEIAAKRGDSGDARAHYARALAIQPDSADANLGMARTLVTLGQPEKARPYLEKAVQLDPSNSAAHFRLAALYRSEGRVEDAQRELAEFQKYKDMKEKLRAIYKEMRVTPGKQERPDSEVPIKP
jgi:tetratricopeptide (TPR) repeat protein